MSRTKQTASYALAALLVASVALCACARPYPQIPASGVVHGQAVQTHVDSELAAYYLANFDAWRNDGSAHARALSRLPPCSAASIGRDSLQELALRTSVDVAGLYAAGCLMEANQGVGVEFRRTFARIRALEKPALAMAEGLLEGAMDYAIVAVPGWDYVDSGPVTGADFTRQLRQFSELGIANYRVEIDPAGGVEQNAAMIQQALAHVSRIHEQIVLVSASSGGPAAALALGDPATDLRHVRAWLNIGGILGGMRLIDRYSEGIGYLALRAFALLKGWDMEAIESMSATRSRERIAKLEVPAHIAVINYIGIPF